MKTKLNIDQKKISGKVIGLLSLSLILFTNLNSVSGISNPESRPSSCKILRAMARVYMADGDYIKALPLAENALTLAKASNSDTQAGNCLIDLAYLYKNEGDFSKAQKFCEMGLELQKKIYYKDHSYIAATLRILSSIYQGQAKYELAKETLSQAICIMRKSHLGDDPALRPTR